MPHKHHRLSLANIGEARKGAFDPGWASRHPSISVWRRSMNVVYERCAGLDVHKRNVVVCANIVDAQGHRHKERQTFSTMTPDLLQLRQWLKDLGVTHVAMESTASYWNILTQDLGYVLLHSTIAGKTGISVEKKQNREGSK